ncbi:cobalt transporter CbiM [Lactiplantibacillus plantarum]|uniref:cobalt transporter CbiM n=1 Tax=Lactiplantibacillus plantarum TaxID=1590 RepID=UPI0005FAA570|nr:cobalt transporter CbiM [Lactiplantibacillus plantarum]MCG0573054.1 cobalamin biosynthesis protein [Lactiplantibacillus plantarum]MCG0675223.1 cobalamin biosynthesis protein [Lactiplantibacillus plantarum]MCG0749309.1 cobalamin biosynthesis protein [Lactiplantibacillus plantarum]MCG0810964.1 cobalamin biosynthesis protein [Lactiplantibacillus plantarum]MCG0863715.1 cobalamin biosynthesis protein [Lactiplantibacillus plantarum]
MHIPDNYLSPATCVIMFAVATPIVGVSIKRVQVRLKESRELAPILGIAASLSFLIMMFNVPVPGGTTAHAVGGTLLAILIGPDAACIAVTVALLLQAFLFGDGGILSLGANIFNMACVMPFTGYWIYNFFRKHHHATAGVLIGSYLGINFAALMAGIELGLQPLIAHSASGQPLYNPYPLAVTIPAMMVAHLAVAGWIEAFFTYVVYKFVSRVAPQEIYQASTVPTDTNNQGKLIRYFYYIIIGLLVLTPLGLLASGTAFGEWSNNELLGRLRSAHLSSTLPHGMSHGLNYGAALSDYTVPGTSLPVGYILCGVTAILIFVIISKVLTSIYGKEDK